MKATRLGQDLARVHEASDRAVALAAVSKRLTELQADHAKLQPASDAAKARAAAAHKLLVDLQAKLAAAAGDDAPPKKAQGDF